MNWVCGLGRPLPGLGARRNDQHPLRLIAPGQWPTHTAEASAALPNGGDRSLMRWILWGSECKKPAVCGLLGPFGDGSAIKGLAKLCLVTD